MRYIHPAQFLLLSSVLLITAGCIHSSDSTPNDADSTRQYYVIDSTLMTEPALTPDEIGLYQKVRNLLEFHTKDSMKTDSTYLATLSMGKNTSPAEMEIIVSKIAEPGGKVQVRDTTQEISLRMAAVLEDKSSPKDPNFLIGLIGGDNNIRTYDPKKNKMIWQWNVTPLKEGKHELMLSISQLDSLGYEAGSPETRHHNITIVSERKKLNIAKSIATFFARNWQWLIGAVGIPLLIVWLNTRQRKHRTEDPVRESVKPIPANWKRRKKR